MKRVTDEQVPLIAMIVSAVAGYCLIILIQLLWNWH